MAIEQRTKNYLRVALADKAAADDLINNLEGEGSFTTQSPVAEVTVTFTAGNPNYTPTGAVTIADGGTPTVNELLDLALELNAKIAALDAVLHSAGLTTG